MKGYYINFSELCNKITNWTWQELLFGLKNNMIVIEDVIDYTNRIISEDNIYFDIIMEILIADTDEIEIIVKKLALKEEKQNEDDIASKWVFSIIYCIYTTNRKDIYDIIDDIYCEFDYPSEIDCLVSYMPKVDGESLDENIKKYIKRGEEIWGVKSKM